MIFIFGIYPLTIIWPSGWAWHGVGQSEYLQRIIAVYATLGFFLWLASADPARHVSLIAFTIWSSIVHAGTMAIQALLNTQHIGHLYGDVPALLVLALVLAWLVPQAFTFGCFRE